MKKIIGNLCISLGIVSLLFGAYCVFERWNPAQVTFASSPAIAHSIQTSTTPIEIVIPSLVLDLPIYPASIHNKQWELSSMGVSYLSLSPIPGDSGNSILYGHNWNNLLGKLRLIKPGDSISVTFSDATTRRFTVEYVTIVSPTDVSILNPTMDSRITLYTCTGFLDSKRLVVTAFLIR